MLSPSIREDAAKAFDEMARKADERADWAAVSGNMKLEECCRSVARVHRENAILVRNKAGNDALTNDDSSEFLISNGRSLSRPLPMGTIREIFQGADEPNPDTIGDCEQGCLASADSCEDDAQNTLDVCRDDFIACVNNCSPVQSPCP